MSFVFFSGDAEQLFPVEKKKMKRIIIYPWTNFWATGKYETAK